MEYPPAALRRQKPKALVIGGAGFLGRHLVAQLLEQGKHTVLIADVRDPQEPRAKFTQVDIRRAAEVAAVCEGVEVVFHCATLAPLVQNTATQKGMYEVNVVGTENVINACIQQGVLKLVYTSSSSVVFEGRDLIDVDESIPLARKPVDFYAMTKADGERMVLKANGHGRLATVALRPSNIYGEHDPLFIPLAVQKAREGKMKYRIGNGTMMPTYAGNAAHAHIQVLSGKYMQAGDALSLDSPLAGQAYFVTDGRSFIFWDFMGDFLEPLGYGRPHIWLPGLLIYVLAWILQWIIIPLVKPVYAIQASEFSPSRIQLIISKRTFSISRAKRDFHYEPIITTEEALQRTIQFFEYLRRA